MMATPGSWAARTVAERTLCSRENVRYQAGMRRALTFAVALFVGLFGGLGLGLLGARPGEVSLERVRVTTWGGYGGGVVGLLVGAAASSNQARAMGGYRGAAIGALAGLVVTFLSTGSLDGIPDEEPTRVSWASRLAPTIVQVAGSDGSLHPGLGLGGTLWPAPKSRLEGDAKQGEVLS